MTRLADPEATGFAANARQQLQELIRQKFNNASVGIWSVGNEVQGGDDTRNNVRAVFKSLHDVAKAEDPSRITTLANQINRSGDVIRPDAITLTGVTDSFSVNRYFQWYYGQSETQLGENLDQIHASSPSQPIGVTEYGAGSGLTHHTDNVRGGRVCSSDTSGSTRICYQPEGYANYVHEKAYEQMNPRTYLMGTWIWNMFDFGSGNRHEGDIGQTNTKGIVTFGRDVKKDVFFFYKANWSAAPVTYIAERRHTERVYKTAQVKVYSNAASVALRVNGVEVARKSAAECPVKVCNFGEVALTAGVNTITAVGDHAGQSVTDFVNWNLSAKHATNVYIAAGQLATGLVSNDPLLGNNVYGSDNYFLNGDLPPLSGRSNVGLSAAIAINGLGATTIPETGRVWDMWREGTDFTYDIPVANGSYKVTLGFLEPTATAAGARVFTVNAEGTAAISDLDVFQNTGAIRNRHGKVVHSHRRGRQAHAQLRGCAEQSDRVQHRCRETVGKQTRERLGAGRAPSPSSDGQRRAFLRGLGLAAGPPAQKSTICRVVSACVAATCRFAAATACPRGAARSLVRSAEPHAHQGILLRPGIRHGLAFMRAARPTAA